MAVAETVKTSRKSTRLSGNGAKAADSSDSGIQQSRITEYLNVRKRGSAMATGAKKLATTSTTASSKLNVLNSASTPVKIKRKISEKIDNARLPLTPSPSLECVNKEDKTDTSSIESSIDEAHVNETKASCASTEEIACTTEDIACTTEEIACTTEEIVPKTVPAYKRFAHLVNAPIRNQKPKLEHSELNNVSSSSESPVASSACSKSDSYSYVPWLPLLGKWGLFDKLIFNVDSLCVLSAGRSQPCIFHKIQKTLENVIGKQVPLEHLERLNTLWPEAYEYRGANFIHQGRRVESVALSVPGLGDSSNSAKLLNERREEVKSRIQKHLLDAHAAFLLKFAKTDLSGEIPKQWHPDFDQMAVSDISRTPLIQTLEAPTQPPPQTPSLIKNLLIIESSSEATTIPNSSTTESPLDSESKKLSLLERIRAKEASLKLHKVLDTQTSRIDAILSQMDRFVQSVMFTFSSSRKNSLFLTDLTEKLIQSSSIPLNHAEVLERLKLLERAAPDWIKVFDSPSHNGPRYVKILEKNRSLNSLLDSIKILKGK
jgi:hypothetical protein